jgi:hypothetical protein
MSKWLLRWWLLVLVWWWMLGAVLLYATLADGQVASYINRWMIYNDWLHFGAVFLLPPVVVCLLWRVSEWL